MSDHSDHGWFREQVFVNLRRPVLISYDGGILTVIMINTAWEHKKQRTVLLAFVPSTCLWNKIRFIFNGKIAPICHFVNKGDKSCKKNYEF